MVNGDATTDHLLREIAELRRQLSEQDRSVAHLRERHERFQALSEEARDYAQMILDADGRITEWDERAANLLGFPAEDVLLHPLECLFAGGGHGHPNVRNLIATASVQRRIETEAVLRRRDESRLWSRFIIQALPKDKRRSPEFLVVIQDVSARKQAEHELEHLFSHSPDLLCISSLDGFFRRLNITWETTLGYSREELQAIPFIDFVHGDDREATKRELQRLQSGGDIVAFENRYRCKDGSYKWLLWNATPLPGNQLIYGTARENTGRKLAEEKLILREQQLAEAQRVAQIGSWEWDSQTRRGTWTDELYGIYGVPPQQGEPLEVFAQFCHVADRDRVMQILSQAMRDGKPFEYEHRLTRHDNRELRIVHGRGEAICDELGKPIRLFGTVQDITERKRMEAQLHQSHKMESIGRLAGGVAHDFNNLLTVINGYSEMLFDEPALDESARHIALEIKRAGERAAALTQQLLAFSRQQLVSQRILDLNAVLRETERLLCRLIGEDIELVLELDPTLGPVRADLAQVEQVVMNLAVNARDAMPSGGRLTISTSNVLFDPGLLRRNTDIRPGGYAVLSISDTGCGMDETTKSHLFEPFFTTKEVGKGTGLGLATIYGIIKQSQGHIEIASEPDRGTTFNIYLPHCIDPEKGAAAEPATPRVVRGDETVLLVEDEPGVREMARLTLQLNGYKVLVAADGEDALDVYRNHRGPLNLLVTDVVMPHVGGRRLADELSVSLPSLRVLFISGYADAFTQADALPERMAFLQKPFTPSVLAQKIRQVLDR